MLVLRDWQTTIAFFWLFITLSVFLIGLITGIFLIQKSFINSCDNIGVFKIGDKIYSCQDITPISFSIILTEKGQN